MSLLYGGEATVLRIDQGPITQRPAPNPNLERSTALQSYTEHVAQSPLSLSLLTGHSVSLLFHFILSRRASRVWI
jgi:hypothetical protein